MVKRQVVMGEIGGVMIAVGVIWFGLSGFKPGWGGITDLLPTWLLQPTGGLLLAVAGALLAGLGRWMTRDAACGEDGRSRETAVEARLDTGTTLPAGEPAPTAPTAAPRVRVFSAKETAAPMIHRATADAGGVWLSDLDTIGHFSFYKSGDPIGSTSSLNACAVLNFQGDVVPPRFIPKSVRPLDPEAGEIDPADHEYLEEATLKQVTLIQDRFLLVGPKVAAVLSQFDLGAGALHPIEVLDINGAPVPDDTHFFWNFGNRRNTFLPEESEGLRKSTRAKEQGENAVYFMPVIPAEDSIALSRDALTGPDVWRERHLERGTFLSDPLVQALRQAKLDHWFELVRCRIV